MALETYKILNNLAPVCLQNLLQNKHTKYSFRYSNILEIPQVKNYLIWKKNLLVLLLLLYGIAYQTTSGLLTASHILRVLFSPGVEQNVFALPVDN